MNTGGERLISGNVVCVSLMCFYYQPKKISEQPLCTRTARPVQTHFFSFCTARDQDVTENVRKQEDEEQK